MGRVHEALAADQAELICQVFDVRPEGNWEGTNVLRTRRPLDEFASDLGLHATTLATRLSQAKSRLLDARNARARPLTDDKVLAGQSGLMLGAYAQAGLALDKPDYVTSAQRAADFVLEQMVGATGRLARASRRGVSGQPAMLEDYAYLADGLIDLYEASGLARYLLAADSLARQLLDDFYDPTTQRLYHSPNVHEPLPFRVAEGHDGQTPNATAVAAVVLTRLSLLLERTAWRDIAEAILNAHGQTVADVPRGHCDLIVASQAVRGPHRIIVFVPGSNDAANRALWRACADAAAHRTLLARLPESPGPEELSLPLFADRLRETVEPTVYLCRDSDCSLPVHSIADLQRALAAAP